LESPIIEDWELQERAELDPEPLIDGILWEQDRAMLIAPQKTGKSIVALQIARALAGGNDFLGFETPKPRRVLYLSGEGDIGELKTRSREMKRLVPTIPDHLFYWPIPQFPMNKPEGLKALLEIGEQVQPDLTIFDPAYSLMSGNMKEDETVGEFLRNLNWFQKEINTALMITHHSHRPRRTDTGQTINEGDQSFYGNFLWSAWPKRIYLLELVGKEKSRRLSCSTYRDKTGLTEPMDLTLVEPSPLVLLPKTDGWSSTMWQIWYMLEDKSMSKADMVDKTGKNKSTGYEAISKLEGLGRIIDVNGIYAQS
jgi:hypothetical protein